MIQSAILIDVEVVLDDHERVARLEQLAERREQLRDVVEMQPGGRLVEDVEQPLAAVRRQMRRDLDALRLAAGQRRRRLAEAQVAEADLVEHLQPPQHLRRAAEERQRLAHGHVEHLRDRLVLVRDLEHLRLEAPAVALLARARTRRPGTASRRALRLRPGTPRSGRPAR